MARKSLVSYNTCTPVDLLFRFSTLVAVSKVPINMTNLACQRQNMSPKKWRVTSRRYFRDLASKPANTYSESRRGRAFRQRPLTWVLDAVVPSLCCMWCKCWKQLWWKNTWAKHGNSFDSLQMNCIKTDQKQLLLWRECAGHVAPRYMHNQCFTLDWWIISDVRG